LYEINSALSLLQPKPASQGDRSALRSEVGWRVGRRAAGKATGKAMRKLWG